MVNLHLEYGTDVSYLSQAQVESWVNMALMDANISARASIQPSAELCIRIVDESEMTALNSAYRKKNQPTNVLSFPANISDFISIDQPADTDDFNLLGDIAICAQVVEQEAAEQGKDNLAHWAHMVVHGCLHLIGMDHQNDTDADEMEYLEITILGKLGFQNPYAENTQLEQGQIAHQAT